MQRMRAFCTYHAYEAIDSYFRILEGIALLEAAI